MTDFFKTPFKEVKEEDLTARISTQSQSPSKSTIDCSLESRAHLRTAEKDRIEYQHDTEPDNLDILPTGAAPDKPSEKKPKKTVSIPLVRPEQQAEDAHQDKRAKTEPEMIESRTILSRQE